MNRTLDIFADIVLSLNGEDMAITAANDKITISMSSLRSSIKKLPNVNSQGYFLTYANRFDALLRQQDWTLYLNYRCFTIAILGSKANRKIIRLLIQVIQLLVPDKIT